MSIFPLYFWTNAFVKKTTILDTVPVHGFQFRFLRLFTWTQPHIFGHGTNTFVKKNVFQHTLLYTQSQNSLWTANDTDIPSSNWLKDGEGVNFTALRDLHRDHLTHHGPSAPIQLGPTATNNFSDLWWPRPTHGHHYPSRPSEITRHAGPDTLVVANHHGFHPITVSKIPPGWSIETFEWNNVQKISLEWDCTLTE